ncbi:MAG: hypothetical protein J7513_14835 [Solirubrobacteraceae bacterium]|nr:hypothetical protein [Solirubrobacteraceae bacterium]
MNCATFKPPTGSVPAGLGERQAMALGVGIRECTDALGGSTAALRRLLGEPLDKEQIGMGGDKVQVWGLGGSLMMIARYERRKTVEIQLHREYSDSGSPQQYCGELGAVPPS